MVSDRKIAWRHALPVMIGLLGIVCAIYVTFFVGCSHLDCVNSSYRWHVVSLVAACFCLLAYDLYVLIRLLSKKHLNTKFASVFKLCVLVLHAVLFFSVFVVFNYVSGRI